MIYNSDENLKIYMKIDSDWFKFIVMISHTRTPNNGCLHLNGDIVYNANNYNHENTEHIK